MYIFPRIVPQELKHTNAEQLKQQTEGQRRSAHEQKLLQRLHDQKLQKSHRSHKQKHPSPSGRKHERAVGHDDHTVKDLTSGPASIPLPSRDLSSIFGAKRKLFEDIFVANAETLERQKRISAATATARRDQDRLGMQCADNESKRLRNCDPTDAMIAVPLRPVFEISPPLPGVFLRNPDTVLFLSPLLFSSSGPLSVSSSVRSSSLLRPIRQLIANRRMGDIKPEQILLPMLEDLRTGLSTWPWRSSARVHVPPPGTGRTLKNRQDALVPVVWSLAGAESLNSFDDVLSSGRISSVRFLDEPRIDIFPEKMSSARACPYVGGGLRSGEACDFSFLAQQAAAETKLLPYAARQSCNSEMLSLLLHVCRRTPTPADLMKEPVVVKTPWMQEMAASLFERSQDLLPFIRHGSSGDDYSYFSDEDSSSSHEDRKVISTGLGSPFDISFDTPLRESLRDAELVQCVGYNYNKRADVENVAAHFSYAFPYSYFDNGSSSWWPSWNNGGAVDVAACSRVTPTDAENLDRLLSDVKKLLQEDGQESLLSYLLQEDSQESLLRYNDPEDDENYPWRHPEDSQLFDWRQLEAAEENSHDDQPPGVHDKPGPVPAADDQVDPPSDAGSSPPRAPRSERSCCFPGFVAASSSRKTDYGKRKPS